MIFKGRKYSKEGALIVVNHNTGTVESVFAEQTDATIEEIIQEMMKDNENSRPIEACQLSLTPVINRGKHVTQVIEGYACKKYTAQYTTMYIRNEKEENLSQDTLIKHSNFSDYFNESISLIDICQSPNSVQGNVAIVPDDCFDNLRRSVCNPNDEISKPPRLFRSSIGTSGEGTKSNSIEASVWLCSVYPIKYYQIASVMHVLSYTSPHIAKFADIIARNHFDSQGFPIKLSIPLFCTMKANLILRNLQIKTLPEEFMNPDVKYLPKQSKLASHALNIQKVQLYSPILESNGGEWKRTSAPTFDLGKTETKDEPDRFHWSSDESEENDESLLNAKMQYETLLHNPDPRFDPMELKEEEIKTQHIESYASQDLGNKGQEKYIILEENSVEIDCGTYEESCTINKPISNVATHSIKAIKTMKSIIFSCTPKLTSKGHNEEILRKMLRDKKKGKQACNLKDIQSLIKKNTCYQIERGIKEENDSLNDSGRTVKKLFIGKNINQALGKVQKKESNKNIAQTYIDSTKCNKIPRTGIKVKMPPLKKDCIIKTAENNIKGRASMGGNIQQIPNMTIDLVQESKLELNSRNRTSHLKFELKKKNADLTFNKKTMDVDVVLKH